MVIFDYNFNFPLRMNRQKNSCERSVYESVEDKFLRSFLAKSDKKDFGLKG